MVLTQDVRENAERALKALEPARNFPPKDVADATRRYDTTAQARLYTTRIHTLRGNIFIKYNNTRVLQ